MEPKLNVSYASMAELDWIEQNDDHVPKQTIENKVRAGEYIIAKIADEPAGCLRFGHFWSTIPYIEVIWVEDRFQRRGIGRAMVRFLEDHARAHGQQLIMSSSQANEPGAQAFHRKIGFRDAGALVDLRPLQSVTEIFFVKEVECSDAA